MLTEYTEAKPEVDVIYFTPQVNVCALDWFNRVHNFLWYGIFLKNIVLISSPQKKVSAFSPCSWSWFWPSHCGLPGKSLFHVWRECKVWLQHEIHLILSHTSRLAHIWHLTPSIACKRLKSMCIKIISIINVFKQKILFLNIYIFF